MIPCLNCIGRGTPSCGMRDLNQKIQRFIWHNNWPETCYETKERQIEHLNDDHRNAGLGLKREPKRKARSLAPITIDDACWEECTREAAKDGKSWRCARARDGSFSLAAFAANCKRSTGSSIQALAKRARAASSSDELLRLSGQPKMLGKSNTKLLPSITKLWS